MKARIELCLECTTGVSCPGSLFCPSLKGEGKWGQSLGGGREGNEQRSDDHNDLKSNHPLCVCVCVCVCVCRECAHSSV